MININTSHIKAGDTFSNYKELCSALSIPIKTGNAKRSQIKEIDCYFKYHKEGNKFIIDEVYSAPLIRFDNKGVYNNILQLVITDYLLKSNKETVVITGNKLLLHMFMYNDNYSYCGQYIPQLSKYTKINEKVIYDFYNTSGSSFRGSLESALNNLRNKSILMYEKLIYVCTYQYEHRRAREYERVFIIETEQEIVKELGYDNMEQIRVSPKWKLFQSLVAKRLKEINIKYHYICYSLTVSRKYIENNHNLLLQFTLDEIERNDLKVDLNNKVMNRLIDNAHKRKENSFTSGRKSKMRSSKTYIDDMTKLIHILIDVNAGNIIGEIENILQKEKEQAEILDGIEDFFG